MANAKTVKYAIVGHNEIEGVSVNLAKYLTTAGPSRVQAYLLSEMKLLDNKDYRNPTRLNKFLRDIKGGMARSNAIHAWVQRFCNVVFVEKENRNEAGDEYKMKPMRTQAEAEKAFAEAMATLWTTCKPDPTARDYSLETSTETFLKNAFKHGVTIEEIEAVITKVQDKAERAASEAIAKAKAKAAKVNA